MAASDFAVVSYIVTEVVFPDEKNYLEQLKQIIYFAEEFEFGLVKNGAGPSSGILASDAGSDARVPRNTVVTYRDIDGEVVGKMKFIGDPFGIKGGAQTPITEFSLSTIYSDYTTNFSNLDPIAADEFQAMFIDLPLDLFEAYADLIGLTNGGSHAIGTIGNDVFNLGTGRSIVTTGDGDDKLFKVGDGNVNFDAGNGIDTIGFYASDGLAVLAPFTQKLVINLTTGTGFNPHGGTLTLNGVENVYGTDFADRITGNNKANFIIGNGAETGIDVINALGGDDAVIVKVLSEAKANGGNGFDQLVFFESTDLRDTAFTDAYANFESFFMTSYGGDHFILNGDDNDNILSANSGIDTFKGRGGDDTIFGGRAFNADFTDGADVAVFSGKRSDYRIEVVDFRLLVTDLRGGSPDGTDRLSEIETLRFSNRDVDTAGFFAQAGAHDLIL